jgi:hypothetical protein
MFRRSVFRNQPPPVLAAIAEHVYRVLLVSGALALLVTLAVAVIQSWDLDLAGWVGLIATLWALFLAMLIYMLTAKDTDRLLDELESMHGALDGIADEIGRSQTPEALTLAKARYAGYVKALLDEYPSIPEADIEVVERVEPEGAQDRRGNTPVIIKTKLRRYSVWRGGRGGGYHITKLTDSADM